MAHETERLKGTSPSLPMLLTTSPRFTLPALVLLLLTACGGGGSSNNNSNNSAVTMYLSPQTVSISAMTTQPAPTSSFEVDVAGLALNGEVWIGVTYTGQGVANAAVSSGDLPATGTIQFKSPSSLGPGTYNDTVTVNVCLDQSCSQPLSNSPQTIRVQYTVTKSTFAVTSLSPTSAYAGAQGFTLAVNGSTFTQQSTVLWNGNSLPTTFVNSSQLTAQVPASDIAKSGNATVSVNDPTYGTTNTETFTVNASPLVISTLSPSSINVGSPGFTLTVTGLVFTAQSTILWNGQSQATVFVSATQLTTQIPTADIATPGNASVSVNDPTYGTSNLLSFTTNPTPLALNSISPTTVTVGGPSFMLTALGTAFTGTSTVEWNGTGLATTLVSSTELVAQVPAGDISATGTASVIVSDPNSPPGTTSAQTVTIEPPSKDAVAYQINPAHSGDITFNSVSFPNNPTWSVNVGGTPSYALIVDGKVIVTVQLSLTSGSAEILALDQTTGATVWGPIMLSGIPTAAYDNGRVFVLSGLRTTNATLTAIDVNTGAIDWSTNLSAMAAWSGLPVAADGTLYAGVEGIMNAVAESSGFVLWTDNVGGTNMTPAVTMDGVYSSYFCLTADMRPATGEFIWQDSNGCGGGGIGMPMVANQLVYSASGNILNAETGAAEGGYSADTPPAFTATMGYFLQSGTLRGVLLSNDTVQWSFAGDGLLTGAPIAVNQYVFIGSSSGNLYALDGTTGTQVWNVNLGAAIGGTINSLPFSSLAAGDGLLIVPAGTTITAYTLSTNP